MTNLKAIFPIIKSTIREINLVSEWADRDSIIQRLLKNKNIQNYISISENNKFDLDWRVANIVDWFSAHFTTKSNFMIEYLLEFERKQIELKSIKGKKRKIWAYKVLTSKIPEEVDATEVGKYSEGGVTKILVNKYERNINARKACISYHGLNCKVCDFNFEKYYGTFGANYIHVHHIKEISKIGKEYIVDPINDLIPVCANCHSMIHKYEPPLTIEELKLKIKNEV